jgi:hypothetical protein
MKTTMMKRNKMPGQQGMLFAPTAPPVPEGNACPVISVR